MDPFSLLSATGALLTQPLLHPNTIRIEVLAHLAAARARGRKRACRKCLEQFLNEDLQRTFVAQLEDPVEDVFVSNVVSPAGNHRIFEGLWETSDWGLQQMLRVIFATDGPPWMGQLRRSVIALLKVSEETARRTENERYGVSEGTPKGAVALPNESRLRALSRKVVFSYEDLEGLGVSPADLDPFILELADAHGLEKDSIGSSQLERRMLLVKGRRLILALPTAISIAIRRYVVEVALANGWLEEFERLLRFVQTDQFLDSLERLGCEPAEAALRSDQSVPRVDSVFARFDVGKYAHVLVLHDSPQDVVTRGFSALPSSTPLRADLVRYVGEAAKELARRDDFRSGLTILICAGLGPAMLLPLPEFPEGWHVASMSLADWILWSWDPRASLLLLWKQKRQIDLVRERGVEVVSSGDDFNTLSYWLENDCHLLPRDCPAGQAPLRLFLASDHVADLRAKLRQGLDRHAAELEDPPTWVEIQHLAMRSVLAGEAGKRIYVSANHARRGELLGAVKTTRRVWWVRFRPPPHQWQRRLAYRIWEATLYWLERLGPQLESRAPDLPKRPIELRMRFVGFEELDSPVMPSEVDAAAPSEAVAASHVRLDIPMGFLALLEQPKNLGERALLLAIARGVSEQNGIRGLLEEDLREIVADVLGGDDARRVHIVKARRAEDHLSDVQLPEPRLVGMEDASTSRLGLGFLLAGVSEATEIHGETECRKALHELVDSLWKRIRGRLEGADRKSVVVGLLKNIEAIARDEHQWVTAARALDALHDDEQDVVRAADERDSERTGANLASRVAIEMATATCRPDRGQKLANSEVDDLLSDVLLLIQLAQHADAVRYGLAEAVIRVDPNGGVRIDMGFEQELLAPFRREVFSGQFAAAADRYDFQFGADPTADQEDYSELIDPGLSIAFDEEFGLSIQGFVDALAALEDLAVDHGTPVAVAAESDLASQIERAGLSPDATNAFLRSFTLVSRERWDEAPPGFSKRDWYPWRFGRRLSVLARPLVVVGTETEPEIAFSVGLLGRLRNYLIGGIADGRLPGECFQSQRMRSWIGSVNDRQGTKFEESVAAIFRAHGWKSRCSVAMTELGASAALGDVDVLAWRPGSHTAWIVECKRLRQARTTGEIGEQLSRFRGEAKDQLAKHLERVRWLRQHPLGISRAAGHGDGRLELKQLLVTNAAVPMQYVRDLPIPTDEIVPIGELSGVVAV